MTTSEAHNFLHEQLEALETFPGREESVTTITRYSLYPVMFYRTNLWTHSQHVFWLVHAMMPLIQKHFTHVDEKRLLAMALIHDDAEIITGDFQSVLLVQMTPEQIKAHDREDIAAAHAIADQFPETFGDYNYRELLVEAVELFTMESRILKYCDKFDGLAEAFHEVFAGNTCFTTNQTNEQGVIPTPLQGYHRYFMEFPRDNEDLRCWLRENEPIFRLYNLDETRAQVETGTPHTRESLNEPTGHLQYDWWRSVMMETKDAELITPLHTQVES